MRQRSPAREHAHESDVSFCLYELNKAINRGRNNRSPLGAEIVSIKLIHHEIYILYFFLYKIFLRVKIKTMIIEGSSIEFSYKEKKTVKSQVESFSRHLYLGKKKDTIIDVCEY